MCLNTQLLIDPETEGAQAAVVHMKLALGLHFFLIIAFFCTEIQSMDGAFDLLIWLLTLSAVVAREGIHPNTIAFYGVYMTFGFFSSVVRLMLITQEHDKDKHDNEFHLAKWQLTIYYYLTYISPCVYVLCAELAFALYKELRSIYQLAMSGDRFPFDDAYSYQSNRSRSVYAGFFQSQEQPQQQAYSSVPQQPEEDPSRVKPFSGQGYTLA